MSARAVAAAGLAVLALVLLGSGRAEAQEPTSSSLDLAPGGELVPPGYRRSAAEILPLAEAQRRVREERAGHPDSYVRAYLLRPGRWQVAVYVPAAAPGERSEEIARVIVDDRTGRVLHVWTGRQVGWRMARGRPGEFGRAVNSPWVWIALCLAFAAPFARRPLRMLHLDLAVLLAFSVSYAFFGAAEIDVSVPSAYPLLLYLLARMLWIAFKRPETPPLRPLLPDGALLFGVAAGLAFRIALNVVNGNVIDVGYASVVGADHLLDGDRVYGGFPADVAHGDTYGPIVYAAYVPWSLIWPWTGTWDDLPAAHAASVAFDLACVAGLWLAGRRLRGPGFGLLLAYLWVTFPFTLLVANSGANDGLVGALVLAAFLCTARPIARGALAVVAGLSKFAPLALVPLFVTAGTGKLRSAIAAGAAGVLVMAPVALGDGLGTFADRTLGFQGERNSPFSIWGLYDLPGWLQAAATVAAAALAIAVAFVPSRRDDITVAALGAAVLIALQLTVTHWFYLYLVWFLPLLLIALLTPAVAGSARSPSPAPDPSSAPARR
ncbi:MAG: hypothetical protein ABW060_10900 [Solirubrobacteraceae bacterium]